MVSAGVRIVRTLCNIQCKCLTFFFPLRLRVYSSCSSPISFPKSNGETQYERFTSLLCNNFGTVSRWGGGGNKYVQGHLYIWISIPYNISSPMKGSWILAQELVAKNIIYVVLLVSLNSCRAMRTCTENNCGDCGDVRILHPSWLFGKEGLIVRYHSGEVAASRISCNEFCAAQTARSGKIKMES